MSSTFPDVLFMAVGLYKCRLSTDTMLNLFGSSSTHQPYPNDLREIWGLTVVVLLLF